MRRSGKRTGAGIHLEDAFQTVADEAGRAPEFWRDFGRVDDPGVLEFVIIGDFCVGSDSPIVRCVARRPGVCQSRR